MLGPNKNTDIRYDMDGSFWPWVVYTGETTDSLYPFNSYSRREDAIKAAEEISSFTPPVGLFVTVFYMPDKMNLTNREEVWSKYVN
jgi:hypothetical protein